MFFAAVLGVGGFLVAVPKGKAQQTNKDIGSN
jgi:hypothetical protein